MSVQGISSDTNPYLSTQQSTISTVGSEFKNLVAAIQSGDLKSAQNAFSQIQSLMQSSQGTTAQQSGGQQSQFSADFAAIRECNSIRRHQRRTRCTQETRTRYGRSQRAKLSSSPPSWRRSPEPIDSLHDRCHCSHRKHQFERNQCQRPCLILGCNNEYGR